MVKPPSLLSTKAAATFRARLLEWYKAQARDLPWRRTLNPYHVWLSEIMLQQTRVAAMLEPYARFLERFPTISRLAAGSEDEVLALWSGLGYYRRARMLYRAAHIMSEDHQGELPNRLEELRALPGVGEYTAAAIASIAFRLPAVAVDGNVERVVTRVCGLSAEPGKPISKPMLRAAAARLFNPAEPGEHNQAMMELGARVCLPRSPLCNECPVVSVCKTKGEHPRVARNKMLSADLSYGLVQQKRAGAMRTLLYRRSTTQSVMPGMWELPVLKGPLDRNPRLVARHAIMRTNYYVRLYMLTEAELAESGDRPTAGYIRNRKNEQWFTSRALAELPLTGLARKLLRRVDVLEPGTGPGAQFEVDDEE